ncbi:hypothetical protein BGZ65_001926 [Modicella reniformis]|uniref:Endothelin-converting enzyme 1 n=1 Tax=Modicella reniformis TaxID=1440133 RepID=A0A9P6IMA9_9FUNG|nr:hypothetical protein BGZ65_001926 [Modicella reniformis]
MTKISIQLLLLLRLLVISTVLQLMAHGAPVADGGICNKPQCLQSAADILGDMDVSSDPCVDFSEFACNGFYKREKLQEGEQINGYLMSIERQNNEVIRAILTGGDNASDDDLFISSQQQEDLVATERNLKKLRAVYTACMNQDQLQNVGRQPLQNEIKKMMDIYPGTATTGVINSQDSNDTVLDGDMNQRKKKAALSTLLGYNMKNGFENPFVFELWDDDTKPGYKIMTVQQSGLGLKDETLYSDEGLVKLYEKVISEMLYIIQSDDGDLTLLNQDQDQTPSIPSVWVQSAKDIVAFEKIIAGITTTTIDQKTEESSEKKPSSPDNNQEKRSGLDDETSSSSFSSDDDRVVEPESNESNESDENDDTGTWDTIDDLNQISPSLDWHLIFKIAFPEDAIIPTHVNMLWKFHLRRVETAFQQSSPKTIQNYFIWTMIRNLGKHLVDSFQGPLKVLDKALSSGNNGTSSSSNDREKSCMVMVNENLGQLAGHFFVKATFPEASQAIVKEMIDSIRWSFEKNFWEYNWLDLRTKQNALQKLKAIAVKVGYSKDNPNVMSSSSMDEFYRNLNISADDHFGNQLRCNTWRMEGMFRSVSQPVSRNKVESNPQTVNAYYNPNVNAIEVLAGILKTPFFHVENPEYLNFAGVGSIAGHELGHAFDDSGRRYDENGAVKDWWTESSVQAFDVRAQCFIDQYNEFTVKGPKGVDYYVNGWRTLGENIADNGGLKMAFEAWQQHYRSSARTGKERLPGLESYTLEQLFFIQYARAFCGNATPEEETRRLNDDNHSPRRWRINGVLQNSDYFVRAFQCKVGAPMNPLKKCVLW